MIEFYKSDIISNQKIALIMSVKPLKRVTSFGGFLLSPIIKPLYRGYYLGLNGFLLGFGEGVGDLYSYMSDNSYHLGVFLVKKLNS